MITIRNLSLLLLLAIGMSLPAAAQQTPTTDRDVTAEEYERMIQGMYNVEFRALAIDALELMRRHNIMQLIVVDEEGGYLGFVHLHDLVKEGLL